MQPDPNRSTDPVGDPAELLCPECGERLHVSDVRSLLLALHLVNACPETGALIGDVR